MFSFRNSTIRTKLTLVVLFVTVVTLILSSSAYILNDRKSFRNELVDNRSSLAAVLAANCASAVAFDDAESAVESLNAIDNDSHLVWAAVVMPDGRVFAQHARTGDAVPQILPQIGEDDYTFENDLLVVNKEIKSGDKVVASLYLGSDLAKAEERTAWFVKMSLAISLFTALVAFVIATLFQRVISRPVKELETAAGRLAVGDLDLKVVYRSRDEIGQLAKAMVAIRDYMRDLSEAAHRIASNDLTVQVEPRSQHDVLSKSFANMVFNLSEMIHQLRGLSTQVVSAATEISASAEQMSSGARNQADQVKQVTAAVQEMATAIGEATRHADDATRASRQASETAGTGGQIVGETIIGMGEIANLVSKSSDSIGRLAESAEQIDKIVNVIEDIADQTNLLALNAAIEAARAGEQGRGFAVVADEVRKLAERTSRATGEIKDVIGAVQDKTEEAVGAMETGIRSVDKGRELADHAGGALQEIVNSSTTVMAMIEQIATAAQEQSASADEISHSVEDIAVVTSETAKGAGEMAAAAEELNRQAESLSEMVSRFKTVGKK
jgi:methyl-accepting chemotaxis protein